MKDITRREFIAGTTMKIAGFGVFGLVACAKPADHGAEQTKVALYKSDDELFTAIADRMERFGILMPDAPSKLPLLRATFTRKEAEFLVRFPFLPKTPEELSERYDMSIDNLLKKMKPMEKKGFIYSQDIDGQRKYHFKEVVFYWYRMPGWPGREDAYIKKMSPLIIKYYDEAMVKSANGYPTKFLRSVPPIATIKDTRAVLPYENMPEFVEKQDYCTVSHCNCRLTHNLDPAWEKSSFPLETCLHFGDLGRYIVRNDMGRKITKKETMKILTECEEIGLVHGITNHKHESDTICNCGPYCVFIKSTKAMPVAGGHTRSSYICVQADDCVACGQCEERCHMNAIRLDENDVLQFSSDQCLGCGVCVYKCPTGNLTLEKRKNIPDVPETYEDLMMVFLKERGVSPVKVLWDNTDSLGEFISYIF